MDHGLDVRLSKFIHGSLHISQGVVSYGYIRMVDDTDIGTS